MCVTSDLLTLRILIGTFFFFPVILNYGCRPTDAIDELVVQMQNYLCLHELVVYSQMK